MITRQKAVEVLNDIIECGIISEELEEQLQDISQCIEAEEELQIHAWGMDDNDFVTLYTAHCVDSPDYPAFYQRQKEIWERHKFEK